MGDGDAISCRYSHLFKLFVRVDSYCFNSFCELSMSSGLSDLSPVLPFLTSVSVDALI